MERSDGERKDEKFSDFTAQLGSKNTEDKHPNKPGKYLLDQRR